MMVQSRLLFLIFRLLIKAYQCLISPIIPGNCRHFPSCSNYAIEALDIFGPYKGAWLIIKRILRCQPWGSSGYDPVPEKLQLIKAQKHLKRRLQKCKPTDIPPEKIIYHK